MGISVTPSVQGGNRTLQLIKEFDPKLRRSLNKTIRTAAAPMVATARSSLPETALSHWVSGRYAYDQAAALRGVQVQIGSSSRGTGGGANTQIQSGRNTTTIPLILLKQNNAGGAVFDVAGRKSSGNSPQGYAFIRGLNLRFGAASRSMWPAAEAHLDDVQASVMAACNEAAAQVNRSLKSVK